MDLLNLGNKKREIFPYKRLKKQYSLKEYGLKKSRQNV